MKGRLAAVLLVLSSARLRCLPASATISEAEATAGGELRFMQLGKPLHRVMPRGTVRLPQQLLAVVRLLAAVRPTTAQTHPISIFTRFPQQLLAVVGLAVIGLAAARVLLIRRACPALLPALFDDLQQPAWP
eukprot:6044557-Prymnesium_polylepis.1